MLPGIIFLDNQSITMILYYIRKAMLDNANCHSYKCSTLKQD